MLHKHCEHCGRLLLDLGGTLVETNGEQNFGLHTHEKCFAELARKVKNLEGWINTILFTFEKHNIELELGIEEV